jgi:ATP-dependent Lhr-like helicase
VVLHTLWGGRLNQPFALAFSAAWEEKYGHTIEVYADNDCLSLMLPHAERPETLISLVTSARLGELLQKRLEGSGFFGARFRECAGRALLINRRKLNERVPLWMSRLRSQKLLEVVSGFKDFPILLEAWRTCLQDEFDLEHLHLVLTELAAGSISWSAVHTSRPSPMAQGMAWRQINQYMYMGDESASGKTSRLSGDLLKDVIFSPDIRPTVPSKIVTAFESKRQRLAPGYSPGSPRDLLDWVKERLVIPYDEWDQLLEAIQRDHDITAAQILAPISDKLLKIAPDQSKAPLIGALETLPDIIFAFYGRYEQLGYHSVLPAFHLNRSEVMDQLMVATKNSSDQDKTLALRLGEWLQFYGPVSLKIIGETLGISPARLQLALKVLVDNRKLITGQLIQNNTTKDLCDTQNFEILLRLTRSDAVPFMEPLPVEQLQLLLAGYQGIAQPRNRADAIYDVLDQLLCYPMRASMWETEVLPARLAPYRKQWLDHILQETELLWIGSRKEEVIFCFESDLDLLQEENMSRRQEHPNTAQKQNDATYADLFSDLAGRYNFSTLQQQTGYNETALFNLLWEGVWRGCIANDSLLPLRQGIEHNFKPPRNVSEYIPSRRLRGRSGHQRSGHTKAFGQWRQARNLAGNWFFLQKPAPTNDPLDVEERNKARIRLLLDRYGIVFRELLSREAAPFRWATLFRSLRIMELSGEVLTGYFFHGIPGLQFISPKALRFLQGRLPQAAVYWMNAADPASMCGVQLDAIRGKLPRRLPSTHLVYHGTKLVMVSQRQGKQLDFHAPPGNPDLARYLGPLHHLLMRPFDPLQSITVETINDQPAASSPYLDILRVAFETVPDYRKISLYRLRGDI